MELKLETSEGREAPTVEVDEGEARDVQEARLQEALYRWKNEGGAYLPDD